MKNIFILTLGCPKNSVDSEHLAGLMNRAGFSLVDAAEKADLVIVNTCGFIQAAVEEGIQSILAVEHLKKEGRIKAIAVVGCMVNRYGIDLMKEFPTVDYWARSEEWKKLLDDLGCTVLGDGRHILTRTPWTRYLKISEGCNCHCAYCAIPGIRGSLVSRSLKSLIDEAQQLVAEGAKELCLVGQELTDYGEDLYGKPSLPLLISELEKVLPRGLWVRLFYLHPSHVDRQFLEHIAASPIVLPWIDVPIQHIDDDLLSRMNRPPVEKHIRELFRIARDMNPDFAFRTTLMVGFPGETQSQFDKLLDFVREIKFDRLGAFTYSREDGTPAASFSGQIPEKVKKARYDKLMTLQQQISRERQKTFVGRDMAVLVDDYDRSDGTRIGRSFRDAPEIDGVVLVSGAQAVSPGQMVRVKIDDSSEYDLYGKAQL